MIKKILKIVGIVIVSIAIVAVLFIEFWPSLGGNGTTFENAFNMLKFVISSLCSQNPYLETGENIRENEKDIFSRLRSQVIMGTTKKC